MVWTDYASFRKRNMRISSVALGKMQDTADKHAISQRFC
jgi:hypothetical protein